MKNNIHGIPIFNPWKDAEDFRSLISPIFKTEKGKEIKKIITGGILNNEPWENIKEKIKSVGKTALKVALPVLGALVGTYGYTKYRWDKWNRELKENIERKERERAEEREDYERMRRQMNRERKGGAKKPKKKLLQAVLFDRNKWNLTNARKWFKKEGFTMPKGKDVHSTANYYRFRVKHPDYDKYIYRTEWLDKNLGVRVIVGFRI